MEFLKTIEIIERNRKWSRPPAYSNWFISRTNDLEEWNRMHPRHGQSLSLLCIPATSTQDAEAVVQHFEKLGMTTPDLERRGQQVCVYYRHPISFRTT